MYRKGRSRYTRGTGSSIPGASAPASASTAVAAPALVPFSSTEMWVLWSTWLMNSGPSFETPNPERSARSMSKASVMPRAFRLLASSAP